jgi:hypothetical protein
MNRTNLAPSSLAGEEGGEQILINTALGLRANVNNFARLKPSKSDRYRVMIFGSARAKPRSFFVYDEVKRVATALAKVGCDIMAGGCACVWGL